MSKFAKLDRRRAVIDYTRELMPGSHYLNATAGNIPGEGFISFHRRCFLLKTNLDPAAKNFANGECFGVRTAYTTKSSGGPAFNTCAGALGREWPAKPAGDIPKDHHYLVKLRELLAQGVHPESLPDLGGYHPRQHLLISGTNKETRGLYWGDYCDQTRHFDCIGFVWYCLSNTIGRHFEYSFSQIANKPGNFYGEHITDTGDWMDADILVKKDNSHIMMVGMEGDTPMIVQASNSAVGLNGNLEVDKKDKNWVYVRLKDAAFK